MGLLNRLMFTRKVSGETVSREQTRYCKGGASWNCRHDSHKVGKVPDIHCYRCNVRLGCSSCVPRLPEVICLSCNNYGHRFGIAKHGNLVPSIKLPKVRTDAGWQRWQGSADPVKQLVNQVIG